MLQQKPVQWISLNSRRDQKSIEKSILFYLKFYLMSVYSLQFSFKINSYSFCLCKKKRERDIFKIFVYLFHFPILINDSIQKQCRHRNQNNIGFELVCVGAVAKVFVAAAIILNVRHDTSETRSPTARSKYGRVGEYGLHALIAASRDSYRVQVYRCLTIIARVAVDGIS